MGMSGRPRTFFLTFCLMCSLFVGTITMATSALASQTDRMKVRGEVVAINVNDMPNVIVLRSTTVKNQELIVGATVDPDVRITRGTTRVSLSNIKVGESVDLVYIKTLEGLVARSIHVR